MRHLNEYQHHLRVLLEPYDAKVSRTVLRGESPSNGADLLDSSGDPDTSKTAASWFGACIFLIAAAQALPLFFGISAT